MSSFLHMCICTMPHTFFYDSKFYFRLRPLIANPVWAQLFCDCQGEASPLKVVFHRRSSYTKSCLPPKVLTLFHTIKYEDEKMLWFLTKNKKVIWLKISENPTWKKNSVLTVMHENTVVAKKMPHSILQISPQRKIWSLWNFKSKFRTEKRTKKKVLVKICAIPA